MTHWKPVTEKSPPPGKVVLLRKAKRYCFGSGIMSAACGNPHQSMVFIAKRSIYGEYFHGGSIAGDAEYIEAEEWAEIPD